MVCYKARAHYAKSTSLVEGSISLLNNKHKIPICVFFNKCVGFQFHWRISVSISIVQIDFLMMMWRRFCDMGTRNIIIV